MTTAMRSAHGADVARLELLEARLLLAATGTLSDDGGQLTIAGTAEAESIVLTLDSRQNRFTLSQGQAEQQVFSVETVRALQVNLGAGDDQFEFKTLGTLRQALNVNVDGGAGNDTVRIRWADDGSIARARLTAVVTGGAGDDAIG